MWNGGQIEVGEDAELNLYNCVLWGNNPHEVVLNSHDEDRPAVLRVSHSLLKGGEENVLLASAGHAGTLLAGRQHRRGPALLGATTRTRDDPYSVQPGSPCIDAGTSDLPDGITLPETDILGNPRVHGDAVDMGAYEFQGDDIDQEFEVFNPLSVDIYPNPVRTATNISLNLPFRGEIEVSIFNIRGQKVKTLLKAQCNAGYYTVRWGRAERSGETRCKRTVFCQNEISGQCPV